jgi:hypothetical protein
VIFFSGIALFLILYRRMMHIFESSGRPVWSSRQKKERSRRNDNAGYSQLDKDKRNAELREELNVDSIV